MKCVGDKMVQNCYAELHNSQTNQKVCNNKEGLSSLVLVEHAV